MAPEKPASKDGACTYWAQEKLLPIAIQAPADRKTRDKLLDRLWQAIEDDGVDYLSLVEAGWGGLCGSREVASYWADRFLGLLRTAWSDPRPPGTMCAEPAPVSPACWRRAAMRKYLR